MTPATLVIALVVLVVVAVIAHAIGAERAPILVYDHGSHVTVDGHALTTDEAESIKRSWREHRERPTGLAVAVLDALDGFDDSHGFLPVPDDVQTERARHIAAQLLRAPEGETR